jgi:RNA 3'-terminal phosphate cyclase (ATP)
MAHNHRMREIDGSYGEGGGQLLRSACALAAITGTALRLVNIRAHRAPPGLAPQHLTAVRAVAALCGARTEGLQLRSQELIFQPGPLRGGVYRFDVGTAGSVTLVLQALMPVGLHAGAPVRLALTGGTDVRAAPPLDYLRFVLLPLLVRLGAHIELSVQRRGYYPRGGGEITVVLRPCRLQGLRLPAPGALRDIHGVAHVSNLPEHIVTRMRQAAQHGLADLAEVAIETQVLGREQAQGPGGAIVLWARTAQTLLGAAEVAQRGVPAERIAANAVQALREELAAGATLDLHASDQLLIYLALARGPSSFLARTLSSHTRTALWLLSQFLPLRARTHAAGGCTRIEIEPG